MTDKAGVVLLHGLSRTALSFRKMQLALERAGFTTVNLDYASRSKALEWCYTGRVFPAQEALAGRLVSKVVPPDDLLPTARALAKEIAAKTAPVSVALIRQMMWRMMGADDPMEAHKVDSRGIYARGRSGDVKEGVVSFLEKRPAQFKDKISSVMPDYFPWWQEREYK